MPIFITNSIYSLIGTYKNFQNMNGEQIFEDKLFKTSTCFCFGMTQCVSLEYSCDQSHKSSKYTERAGLLCDSEYVASGYIASSFQQYKKDTESVRQEVLSVRYSAKRNKIN